MREECKWEREGEWGRLRDIETSSRDKRKQTTGERGGGEGADRNPACVDGYARILCGEHKLSAYPGQ